MIRKRAAVFQDPDSAALLPITGIQIARYTHDMLDTLSRIALRHEQVVLARLLEAAAGEAGRLAETGRRLTTPSKPCFRDGVSAVPRVPTP